MGQRSGRAAEALKTAARRHPRAAGPRACVGWPAVAAALVRRCRKAWIPALAGCGPVVVGGSMPRGLGQIARSTASGGWRRYCLALVACLAIALLPRRASGKARCCSLAQRRGPRCCSSPRRSASACAAGPRTGSTARSASWRRARSASAPAAHWSLIALLSLLSIGLALRGALRRRRLRRRRGRPRSRPRSCCSPPGRSCASCCGLPGRRRRLHAGAAAANGWRRKRSGACAASRAAAAAASPGTRCSWRWPAAPARRRWASPSR